MHIHSTQYRDINYISDVGFTRVRLASLRKLQSAKGEELSALMASILDKAFKGEM